MKQLLALTTLLVSFCSFASFYQTDCSNAQSTISTSNGHVRNAITLTKRIYSQGAMKETKVKFKSTQLKINILSKTEIERNSSTNCKPGMSGGVASWNNISLKKIVITKKDNTEFDSDIVGLDKKTNSITTTILCEDVGNSRTMCSK